MRDASVDDMAKLHIARLMEAAAWAPDNALLRAIIGYAVLHYIDNCMNSTDRQAAFSGLKGVLGVALAHLPEQLEPTAPPAEFEDWLKPHGIQLSELSPELMKQRFAYYWTTEHWKSDFLTALESQFWRYKDYAHAAGQGKMPFLREFAEVWIAAATTALVRYGRQDKRGWRATANMLRRHADMIEADGLRALPWGPWGHIRDDPRED